MKKILLGIMLILVVTLTGCTSVLFPDTVEKYQFTKGYFSTEFVSFESESINFPTYRFKHK